MDTWLYQFLSYYERVYNLPFFRVGLIGIALLFFFFSIGMVRKHYFHLTMKGANSGFLAGILITLIFEAAIGLVTLYGGKSLELIMGKNTPWQVRRISKIGSDTLGTVLGQSACQKQSRPTATSILEQLPELSKLEEDKLRSILCK